MIAQFLGAVQFLTTVPIRGNTASPGASAAFFPVVGALIGVVGALVLLTLRQFLPASLAAAVVLLSWALLTGGLHEDGLADIADGFRAGRSRERVLAIMKDSRIGAHGALALVLLIVIRCQALSSLSAPPLIVLPLVCAVSRTAVVVLAWVTPPAGDGLGFLFSRALTSGLAAAAILQSVALTSVVQAGLLLIWGVCIIVWSARAYFVRRIGGVTGDCLGATGLLVETWGLVLYACPRCL